MKTKDKISNNKDKDKKIILKDLSFDHLLDTEIH